MARPLEDPGVRQTLAEACGREYRALVALLASTGLTWREAVALAVRDCDPQGRAVQVVSMAVEAEGGVRIKPRRRGYSASVEVKGDAREALAAHLAGLEGVAKDSLVFVDSEGGPIRLSWFTEAVWQPALAELGLPADITVDELALERLREGWEEKTRVLHPEASRAAGCDAEEPVFWPTEAAYAALAPAAVSGWREWDSVSYLLSAPCIASGAAPFVDVRRQSIDWTGLKRAGRVWSHGARLLVGLANNLWNSTGRVCVRELVDTLDAENFARVLRAIELSRGIAPEQSTVRGVR